MKAFVLFLVRVVTGGSLVAFAASKIIDMPAAIEASDKLYMGYASTPVAQQGLAAFGAVLGIFVILGFLRTFSYGAQFVVCLVGAVAAARVGIALPVGFAGGVASVILLSAAFSLALLSLVLMVWRADDDLALDRFIGVRKSGSVTDAVHTVAHAEPVHAEPQHDTHAHDAHAHDAHGHDDHHKQAAAH